jgi:hypothetical protein
MSITTGQFFRCILLAASRTPMQAALQNAVLQYQTPTLMQWDQALTAWATNNPNVEDNSVLNHYHFLLNNAPYSTVLQKLLTPVTYLGNSRPTIFAMADLMSQLAQGATGILNVPWPTPPHPGGNFVWKLMGALDPYDEQ